MKNNEEPIVALPNKTREEISYNYNFALIRILLKSFLSKMVLRAGPGQIGTLIRVIAVI